jgi:hypothetical protein
VRGIRFAAGVLVVGLTVAAVTGCSGSHPGHSETISQADFDGNWPFMVSSGTLRCIPNKSRPPLGAVIFKSEDTAYALNGAAHGLGYPWVRPIRDESHPGVGDVLVESDRLCPNLGP